MVHPRPAASGSRRSDWSGGRQWWLVRTEMDRMAHMAKENEPCRAPVTRRKPSSLVSRVSLRTCARRMIVVSSALHLWCAIR